MMLCSNRIIFHILATIGIACIFFHGMAVSKQPPKYKFDTSQRQLWTSGKIVGTPEPPDAFTTENAFPHLKFDEPLAACQIPGTRKLCVATRPGKVFCFDLDLATPAQLMLDLQTVVYGIAFHPRFQQNGQLFVTNFDNPSNPIADGAKLSRFTLDPQRLNVQPNSRREILSWTSGGHNGGCIRFGPDEMLYISVGDSSGIADQLQTGQDISDLSGSILRIDVSSSQGESTNYRIPQDNPFASTAGARPEVWAFGLRHVWKFSFDSRGRLWAGDVGQDLWESLHLIHSGGNYGWSIVEAGRPFRPERKQGPGEIVAPIVSHSHSDFRSITAGYEYRSSRLQELNGQYIYGDYDTGKVWALELTESNQIRSHRQLADTQLRIVEFAQDDRGEVYAVDFVGGGLHRIIPNPTAQDDYSFAKFPKLLSQTGLFASTVDHQPAAGVLPYTVNAPLWSDGAEKHRFIAIPGEGKIVRDAVHYPHPKEYSDLGWKFPDGTVLVKTFSLPIDADNPTSTRRIETRIMQFQQMPGDDDEYGAQRWNSYTYAWNEQQTDAELVEAAGRDILLTINDQSEPNGQRKQVWHLPSRSECALCHTMGAKYALGVTTLQMNRDHDYGNGPENQLEVLSRLGIFSKPLEATPDKLPRLVDYRDPSQPLHLRARACLHANCAHCHRKWGGGNADFELQASIPLLETGTVNTYPGQGTFGLDDPRILVPGDAQRSLILKRMSLSGLGKMPHIGTSVTDEASVKLVSNWIEQLEQQPALLAEPGAINPRLPSPKSQPTDWLLLSLYGATGVLCVLTWIAHRQRKPTNGSTAVRQDRSERFQSRHSRSAQI